MSLSDMNREVAARRIDPEAFQILGRQIQDFRPGREDDPWSVFFECAHRGIMLHPKPTAMERVMRAYAIADSIIKAAKEEAMHDLPVGMVVQVHRFSLTDEAKDRILAEEEARDIVKVIDLCMADELPLSGEACIHGSDRYVCPMKGCNPLDMDAALKRARDFLDQHYGEKASG